MFSSFSLLDKKLYEGCAAQQRLLSSYFFVSPVDYFGMSLDTVYPISFRSGAARSNMATIVDSATGL